MPIDLEARERGNSVYFPRRVIPMLPEVLSNGLCSLMPEVDRLCMVCEMDISARGDIADLPLLSGGDALARAAHLYPGRAGARGSARRGRARAQRNWCPTCRHCTRSTRVSTKARALRGAIDFETIETQMFFDDAGQDRAHRSDAAQRCPPPDRGMHAGGQRLRLRFPVEPRASALYRVHEGPTPEKLAALREFLREFGLQLTGGDEPAGQGLRAPAGKNQDRARTCSCCRR